MLLSWRNHGRHLALLTHCPPKIAISPTIPRWLNQRAGRKLGKFAAGSIPYHRISGCPARAPYPREAAPSGSDITAFAAGASVAIWVRFVAQAECASGRVVPATPLCLRRGGQLAREPGWARVQDGVPPDLTRAHAGCAYAVRTSSTRRHLRGSRWQQSCRGGCRGRCTRPPGAGSTIARRPLAERRRWLDGDARTCSGPSSSGGTCSIYLSLYSDPFIFVA